MDLFNKDVTNTEQRSRMKVHITKRKGKDMGERGEVIYKLLTSISSLQISRGKINLALSIMSMKDILSTDKKYFIKKLE